LGAAVDIEHFQIIVNAMLSWQGESHAPKKATSRPAVAASRRDELDDDDDEEEFIDEEEFEPEESLNIKPEPAESDAVDADLSDSEQLD
jgi:hypothetical protein